MTLLSPARSSNAGLAGRGIRFGLAGAVVTLIYLALTTGLHEGLGVPFQVALVIGFTTAIAAHFTLQRVFVWVHAEGFALPVRQQAVRYLAVAGIQYGATAAATATLPGPLGVRVTFVYLATAVLVTIANFFVLRMGVFHSRTSSVR